MTHTYFSSSKGSCVQPILVILMHPKADYTGKNAMLSCVIILVHSLYYFGTFIQENLQSNLEKKLIIPLVKGASFVTVAAKYTSQLSNLMSTLQATHPHFVRCILPNHAQKPGNLEDACVLDQLRCNGMHKRGIYWRHRG